MNRELSRKERGEQIMNALYHYLDHKLVSKSEASLENHDVANVALSYATLISQERLGRTNLYISFTALALSLVSLVTASCDHPQNLVPNQYICFL